MPAQTAHGECQIKYKYKYCVPNVKLRCQRGFHWFGHALNPVQIELTLVYLALASCRQPEDEYNHAVERPKQSRKKPRIGERLY